MYYSDKPIDSNHDDQLGRNNFAKLLAQTLLHLNSQDTFSVGLFGKWGSGKTSIVNMMLHEIEEQQKDLQEDEKLIIVHFEPWNFAGTDQLLAQFFIRLSNEFRNTDDERLKKIGNALEKYADAFDFLEAVPYVGGLLGFLGKKGAAAVGGKLKKDSDEKDILKQKESVVQLLRNQASRILVVIDDIDRLSNEQIRQVFQLVTSVAKFPNTIYLLVFDKEIVVRALEKVQEGSGEDYLEKIIQMPIQIPDANPAKLRQVLLDRLDMIFSEHEGAGFQAAHWQKLYGTCIIPFIDSLRTINRLCNAVQFKITSIYKEIDFTDMVAISLLEIQFPNVYEWVKVNKSILTGEGDFSTLGNQNKAPKDWYEFYSGQLYDVLQGGNSTYTDESQLEKIMEFLSYLFPYFGRRIGKIYEVYQEDAFRRNNQIAHPDKFDRYFVFDLDGIVIKKSEVERVAFELDGDELAEFLVQQEKDGTSYEFLEEIRAITSDLSSDRAKIMITALLKVSGCLDTRSQKNFLFLPASALAEYLVMEFMDRIDPSERFQFLSDTISNSDLPVLESMADIMNKIELRYGRLAANGEEREGKKIITLEELEQMEAIFTEKVKQVLVEHNLFDLDRWGHLCYLLECFDPDYAKEYLDAALKDDTNIVRYVAQSVGTWTGSGVTYEVQDSYKNYLTEERILQAIEALRDSEGLFLMPEKVQRKCAAFYIDATSDRQNNEREVSQTIADSLLSSWKSNAQHPIE